MCGARKLGVYRQLWIYLSAVKILCYRIVQKRTREQELVSVVLEIRCRQQRVRIAIIMTLM